MSGQSVDWENSLKIVAVTLGGVKKFTASAVYDGELLLVTHCQPITGNLFTWKKNLLEDVQERSKAGALVVIEDKSQAFCVGDAQPFDFEDLLEGRSILYHSLDYYFSLLNTGRLMVDKEVERFLVREGGEGQKIEKTQDDKGRTVYKVDWRSLSPGFKAILMCVHTATRQPLSENYIEEFFRAFDGEADEPDPLKSFHAITTGVDRSRDAKWDDFYNDEVEHGRKNIKVVAV